MHIRKIKELGMKFWGMSDSKEGSEDVQDAKRGTRVNAGRENMETGMMEEGMVNHAMCSRVTADE